MKILTRLMASLSLIASAQICVADDSTDRQPEALRGITSVVVKVTDKSRIPGMPAEAMVQSQVENLLQTKCGLDITAKTSPPGPEVHVDLLMFPVVVGQPKATASFALVRTTVWRPAVPTTTDGITPDPSKSPIQMTAWVLTTITDPKLDPLLATTILNHANALESTLRAAGQMQVLPGSFSEAFFASRVPEMKRKLEALFNQRLAALPSITPAITVDLTLNNGILTYRFRGKIVSVAIPGAPFTFDVGPKNPEGTLDLAALSAVGALSTAKICLNGAPLIPGSSQCVTIANYSNNAGANTMRTKRGNLRSPPAVWPPFTRARLRGVSSPVCSCCCSSWRRPRCSASTSPVQRPTIPSSRSSLNGLMPRWLEGLARSLWCPVTMQSGFIFIGCGIGESWPSRMRGNS